MKMVFTAALVATIVGTGWAGPLQNGCFTVPESGPILVDGNLSDWTQSTAWSDAFVRWAGSGAATTSTTQAKFTWNQASSLLYVAYRTNESSQQPGGHPVIGVSQTATGVPVTAVGATQLAFDISGSGVATMNEIKYFKDKYGITAWAGGGTSGVQAAFSVSGGEYTYEFAIPLWDDWATMNTRKTLSPGVSVYMYGVMEDKLEGGNGTDMTYAGNPNFFDGLNGNGAELHLVTPEPGVVSLLSTGALTLLGIGALCYRRRKRSRQ